MPKDICLIVPTVRDVQFLREYFKNAESNHFDTERIFVLLLTEDFCDIEKMKQFLEREGINGEVFDEKSRRSWFAERKLQNLADVIPRRSHAETSFGLLWMYANDGFDYGLFVDDDTLPHEGYDYFGRHLENLNFQGKVDVVSSDKKWVNVLYQNFRRHMLYPRGYPYSCMGETVTVERLETSDIVASQGLWTNAPDLDTIRILSGGGLTGRSAAKTMVEDFKGNFVVRAENYLTISSMNVAFKREVIPAFYQLPMDDNEWGIARFDDIWSGVFLKKACDSLNRKVITGHPLCVHNKAERNIFKDLRLEAPGLEINEHLWDIVDPLDCSSRDFYGVYQEMAEKLKNGEWKLINGKFLNFIGGYMEKWLKCMDSLR